MDGGLAAIGGFLQQTVGALGLRADMFQEYTDAPLNNEDDLETLLGFAKKGTISYEDTDQDASIKGLLHDEQSGYILIQVKYSSLVSPPDISQSQMQKIILRLKESEKAVCARGEQVTGFSLLTNRQLAPAAKHLADTCHPHFFVCSSIPQHYWRERLRCFAQRFGCSQREIENGIRQGIGVLLEKATHPRHYGNSVITAEMLVELFTGHKDAREVTPQAVARESQLQLCALSQHHFHLGRHPIFVRQSIHQEISRLVEQHAFVIISGIGGCGKTTTLYQWIQENLAAQLPSHLGTYYSLSRAKDVQKPFLTREFCKWAHVSINKDWQEPEQILDRLEIARQASQKPPSGSHPIFFLGLDAIDEAFLQYNHQDLRELLEWFWEQETQAHHQPRATLIVTCRDTNELAERWLSISSPYAPRSNPFRDIEISIGMFSPSDLLAIARSHLSSTVAERFAQTYRALSIEEPSFFAPSLETMSVLRPESASVRAVDPDIFTALRHPTLWRCLLELERSIQSQVLDGEEQALGDLAFKFLEWFCQKRRIRERYTDRDSIMPVLKEIACYCHPHRARFYPKKDWLLHASKTDYMGREQATLLFEEACSAGLILREPNGQWRWYHPFIGEYLTTWSPNEEDEI